jgi:hypothetical protein
VNPLITVNWLLPLPGKLALILSDPELLFESASVAESQERDWKAEPNQLLQTLPIWPPE